MLPQIIKIRNVLCKYEDNIEQANKTIINECLNISNLILAQPTQERQKKILQEALEQLADIYTHERKMLQKKAKYEIVDIYDFVQIHKLEQEQKRAVAVYYLFSNAFSQGVTNIIENADLQGVEADFYEDTQECNNWEILYKDVDLHNYISNTICKIIELLYKAYKKPSNQDLKHEAAILAHYKETMLDIGKVFVSHGEPQEKLPFIVQLAKLPLPQAPATDEAPHQEQPTKLELPPSALPEKTVTKIMEEYTAKGFFKKEGNKYIWAKYKGTHDTTLALLCLCLQYGSCIPTAWDEEAAKKRWQRAALAENARYVEYFGEERVQDLEEKIRIVKSKLKNGKGIKGRSLITETFTYHANEAEKELRKKRHEEEARRSP